MFYQQVCLCVCVLAYLMHSCAVGVALPPLCCSWPLWPPALALVFCVFGWASVFSSSLFIPLSSSAFFIGLWWVTADLSRGEDFLSKKHACISSHTHTQWVMYVLCHSVISSGCHTCLHATAYNKRIKTKAKNTHTCGTYKDCLRTNKQTQKAQAGSTSIKAHSPSVTNALCIWGSDLKAQ